MSSRLYPFVLILGLLAVLVLALLVGSVALPASQVLNALGHPLALAQAQTPLDLIVAWRVARSLAAVAVGALLGIAGALLQALLRNPLADPYVLGISSGASCAAALAMLLGADWAWMTGSAALGGVFALVALFFLARNSLFGRDRLADPGTDDRLILSGVMIGAVFSALLSVMLALGSEHGLRGMMYWLLGDFSSVTSVGLGAAAVVFAVVCFLLGRRDADALTRMLGGDLLAFSQGIDAANIRRRLVLLAACASGVSVAIAGAVGFVGFLAPHLARRLVGSNQARVLPLAALIGALLVLSVDTLARTVVAPVQLPVGALMALLGAPLFFWKLHRA